jgi:hypothetical protein
VRAAGCGLLLPSHPSQRAPWNSPQSPGAVPVFALHKKDVSEAAWLDERAGPGGRSVLGCVSPGHRPASTRTPSLTPTLRSSLQARPTLPDRASDGGTQDKLGQGSQLQPSQRPTETDRDRDRARDLQGLALSSLLPGKLQMALRPPNKAGLIQHRPIANLRPTE